MTEGTEEVAAGPPPSPAPASPASSTGGTGQVPKEKPPEMEPVAEAGEEGAAEGVVSRDGEQPLGIVAFPGTCCVCVEVERINGCLHSEKICILPILACLLSLALCTAGLKWVFVDKIFQYEPPTHLDPKPIGQDAVVMSVGPSLGMTATLPHSPTPAATAVGRGTPRVFPQEPSAGRPHVFQTGRVTQSGLSVPVTRGSEAPGFSGRTPPPQTTRESSRIPALCK